MKKYLLILILIIPTFSLMLRRGIFTMHDPHLFRQYEFDKCIKASTFPCRWASDSGMGYGEPLFNYYGQFPYWVGQIFHSMGFQIIDSVKIVFILSLVLSAIFMYLLARDYWGNLGGIVSAIFYVYAPYRAVDVWVRGNLSESLAFVFYPLILYALEKKKPILLSLSLAGLITTHNLSLFMFAPFLVIFWIALRNRPSLKWTISSTLVSLFLSAYYLLPLIFENKFISISNTVQGYYDYHIHFTTLKELFISRFWGYGASLWARKFLSVSIGHLHWLLPLVLLPWAIHKRWGKFILFSLLGVSALFLTHGKSAFIWNLIPPMKYIQFPWRYLSVATFFLSLSCGALVKAISNKFFLSGFIVLLLLLNAGFFRPDIWRNISDKEQFSGPLWDEGRASSLGDYWPNYGTKLPTSYSFQNPKVLLATTEYFKIQYPITYFLGWTARIDGRLTPVFPSGELGLLTIRVPLDYSKISLRFVNTWPRALGNYLSFITLISMFLWHLSKKRLPS